MELKMLSIYDTNIRKDEQWCRNPMDEEDIFRIYLPNLQEKRPELQQGDPTQ